ncbi:MAG: ankyrin repeat domain-containing protein [Candidatus Hydrogenedentota bacterium]
MSSFAQDDYRATQLLEGIRNGDVQKVNYQLRDRVYANYRYADGQTPLHIAVTYRRKGLAQVLLTAGADPLLINRASETPLDGALESRQNMMVAYMYLALPESIRFDYLMYILDGLVRHDAAEHIEYFMEYLPEGKTVEYYEMDFLFQAASQGSAGMLRLFLRQGRTLSESDPLNGWTVLHHLASGGHLELIQELFADNPGIDIDDGLGQTPLSVAVATGHLDVAAYLIGAGANVNSVDGNGYTPLHQAAHRGHAEFAQLLLDNHADASVTTKSGRTPLDVALERHHTGLLRVFPVDAPTKLFGNSKDDHQFAMLRAAVQAGRVREVESLLNTASVSINKIDKQGMALIHYASRLDTPGLMEALVAAGADVNLHDPLSSWSPLMSAVAGDHVRTTKVLLMSGADINHQDVRGWTALHLAHLKGNEEMIRALELAVPMRELLNEEGKPAQAYSGFREDYIDTQRRKEVSP